MQAVEVPYQLWAHDELSQDPRAFLWTISLPVHQVSNMHDGESRGANILDSTRRGRSLEESQTFCPGWGLCAMLWESIGRTLWRTSGQ